MKKIINIWHKIQHKYALTTPKRFEAYLRKKGARIGKNIYWGKPKTISIDLSRPCLVEIGDNVRLNSGTSILTHDFPSYVFRLVYNDFVPSTAKVTIGSNIYFGRNCTILKGVTIGDNCIIGFGSLVVKDIPANSVAAGVPAKVICTLDEYYQKRKKVSIEESKAYAREIQKYYGRKPVMEDFREEFPLFWTPDTQTSDAYLKTIRFQLGDAYSEFVKNNKPLYASFEDFLEDSQLDLIVSLCFERRFLVLSLNY